MPKTKFAKLSLGPNDLLVVRVPLEMEASAALRLQKCMALKMNAAFGAGAADRLVVATRDIEFVVIEKALSRGKK